MREVRARALDRVEEEDRVPKTSRHERHASDRESSSSVAKAKTRERESATRRYSEEEGKKQREGEERFFGVDR